MPAASDTPRAIALVTYDARPQPTDDDALLVHALEARGARVEALPWSDPDTPWSRYDAVVVRSCWDYFHRPTEFRAWIDRVERDGVALFNDAATIRWNVDKHYLRELEARGVPIVPTRWIARGPAPSLAALRRETGWDELVVKPTVSGGAHRTWRISPNVDESRADDARLAELAAGGDVMVQPMLAEIERDGEWSLLFVDGAFSHAIVKRPRAGDFRVQLEHGGSAEPASPPSDLLDAARRALAAAPSAARPPLYARVDGCVVNGALLLMELELIEPVLSLGAAAGAAERLADALLARVSRP